MGDELNATEWLSNLWQNLHTSDVWVKWPLGYVSGLLLEAGAVDNSPLTRYLEGVMSEFSSFGRRITTAAAEVNTGVYTEFD